MADVDKGRQPRRDAHGLRGAGSPSISRKQKGRGLMTRGLFQSPEVDASSN